VNPGDLVTLKSGGPVMTVDDVAGETVTCVWFTYGQGGAKFERESFSRDALIPAAAGASGSS
jgi:uncharacterized protein YodC (DUF2158 family)